MILAFINASNFWGGGEKWHFTMSKALADRGEEIHFWGQPQSPLHQRLQREKNIFFHPIFIKKMDFLKPWKILHFTNELKATSPDALIINGSAEMKLVALAGSAAGISRIIYRRGLDVRVNPSWINKFLLRKKITGIIANSEATKERLLGSPPLLPPQKVKVLYNGLELDPFLAHPLPAQLPQNQKWIIGTAGRLVPQKGQHLLIQAAEYLLKEGKDLEVHIAGEGRLLADLQAQVRSLSLEKRVKFLGFVENMPDFYASLDIFALPSLWEGFGFALAEAMAAGRPIVAFDVSSIPEIVSQGQSGLLSPPGELNPFAKNIGELVEHPQKALDMGRRGREASKKFRMEEAIEELLDYLKK